MFRAFSQCNTEPSYANTEVLRLKQMHYLIFIAYFEVFLKGKKCKFLEDTCFRKLDRNQPILFKIQK